MKLIAQLEPNLHQIEQNGFPGSAGPGAGSSPGLNFGVGTNIGQIISAALPLVFTVAGMILLIYLIFGGLQLMLSRGDPKSAGGAKAHITNALIGFIIIFVAYWAVQLVGLTLGLQGITTIFK
jgi:hypothetical protein